MNLQLSSRSLLMSALVVFGLVAYNSMPAPASITDFGQCGQTCELRSH